MARLHVHVHWHFIFMVYGRKRHRHSTLLYNGPRAIFQLAQM